jgi:hypothetical protein
MKKYEKILAAQEIKNAYDFSIKGIRAVEFEVKE